MELGDAMERLQVRAANLSESRFVDVNVVSSAFANVNLQTAAFTHANNGTSLN